MYNGMILNPFQSIFDKHRFRIDSDKSANDIFDMRFWEMSLLYFAAGWPRPGSVLMSTVIYNLGSELCLFLEQEAVSPRASVYPEYQ